MPQIPQYTTQVQASSRGLPDPRASAAGVGNAISGFGATLGDIGDHLYKQQAQTEVTDVQTKLAQARADWTVKQAQMAQESDPGDPHFADKFLEDFQNDVGKLGDNISTREGQQAFKTGMAELTAHFTQSSGLYQAASMGVKAVTDYQTFLDANRNTVFLDPSQFGSVLAQTETALGDKTGVYANMPADDRIKLERQTKEQLALSTVEGLIRQSPQAAMADLKSGKYAAFLDADKTNSLMGQATTAITAQEVDAQRRQRLADKAQKDAEENTLDKIINDAVENPASLTASSIAASNLKPSTKLELIGKMNAGFFDKPAPTKGSVFTGLLQRIYLPDGDPNKLTDPSEINKHIGVDLSLTDARKLRSEIQGKGTPDGQAEAVQKRAFLSLVKSQLTKSDPLTGIRDPKGDELYYQFQSDFLSNYAKQRAAGKSSHDLLDPTSKDYLGRPIASMRRSPAQAMQDAISHSAQPEEQVVTVKTPDEARALKPGTKFKTPDGRVLVR